MLKISWAARFFSILILLVILLNGFIFHLSFVDFWKIFINQEFNYLKLSQFKNEMIILASWLKFASHPLRLLITSKQVHTIIFNLTLYHQISKMIYNKDSKERHHPYLRITIRHITYHSELSYRNQKNLFKINLPIARF